MNLTPIQCEGLNCFDANLITLVNAYCQEYECAFAESYYFLFNPQKQYERIHIGLSLHQSEKNKIHDKCSKYYGMHAEKMETTCFLKTLDQLLEQKKDIIVMISAFWCPWTDEYQNTDIDHSVIITERNEQTIICVDSMLSIGVHELPVENFLQGCKEIHIVNRKEQIVPYDDVLKDFIRYMRSITVERAFQDFLQALDSMDDISLEFPDGEISLIDRALSYYLPGVRIMLQRFLLHINKRNQINYFDDKIINMVSGLADEWKMVRAFILRSHYKGNYKAAKQTIVGMVNDIREKEIRLVKYFQKKGFENHET